MYKKYSYRDGKRYGPYLYENKRVGDKVVTNYVGKDSRRNDFLVYSLLFLLFLAIMAIVILAMNISPTGRVSSSLENVVYKPGEYLAGLVKFNVRAGELIPSGSQIVISEGDQQKFISISDLLIKPDSATGTYYAENSNLVGSGEGYGVPGTKKIYPVLDFQLLVYSSLESAEQQANETQNGKLNEQIGESNGGNVEQPISSGSDSFSITGNAFIENAYVIDGKVINGKDYSYTLENGQRAEIVKGSVKFNGTNLSDDDVKLSISGTKVKVSTDYSYLESGFGADYLGDYDGLLQLDLASTGIKADSPDLKIEIVYNDQTILSTERNLNLISENGTVISESSANLRLIKNIPTIRMPQDSTTSIDLSDYFLNAVGYTFSGNNVKADIESGILRLTSGSDFKGALKAKVTAVNGNVSLDSNEFAILVSSGVISIQTSRSAIKVGQSVKWTQNVSMENPENIVVEVPKEAQNIEVKPVEASEISHSLTGNAITGFVSVDIKLGKESKFITFFKKLFTGLTGRVIGEQEAMPADTRQVLLDENVTNYLIQYETPAPVATEKEIANGKEVIISAPTELNYTDVLSFANISEVYSVGEESKIRIYWKENKSYVPFDAYDMDGNGKLDYVEWITPHLSSQTFEIILIIKAEHLDSNRKFLEDIYNGVKAKDNVWVDIPSNDYVRVKFEKNLTSGKDMTLYAKGRGDISVYNENADEAIGNFAIDGEKEYKIYPNYTNSDVYDLLFSGSVSVDYIVDPELGESCTQDSDCTTNMCGDLGYCTNMNTGYNCYGGNCNSGNYCDMGTCYAQLGLGEGCNYDYHCLSGSCGNNAHCTDMTTGYDCYQGNCNSGNYCDMGTCYAQLGLGNSCSSDGQCLSNICGDNSHCTDITTGYDCHDSGCASGNYCDTGTCYALKIDGDSCMGSSECSSGMCGDNGYCTSMNENQNCYQGNCNSGNYCDMGTCYAQKINGLGCSNDYECSSGSCGYNGMDRVCTNGEPSNACFYNNFCAQSYYCSIYMGNYVCTNGETGVDRCMSGVECVEGYCDTYNYCSNGIWDSYCNSNSDCNSGLGYYCGVNYKCTNATVGYDCFSDNTCAEGGCSSGTCEFFTPTLTIYSPSMSDTYHPNSGGYSGSQWSSPSVDWGGSTTCQYQYSFGSPVEENWIGVNCSSNGSDILAPSDGSGINLYVRGNNGGDWGSIFILFSYDSTPPNFTITYPENGITYGPVNWSGGYTYLEFNGDMYRSCQYTLNGGSSWNDCLGSISVQAQEGANSWGVSLCDDYANCDEQDVLFTYDSPPLIEFTSSIPIDKDFVNADNFNVSMATSDNNGDHYAFLNFNNSLVGWWRGENNANDSSGNGNNGQWTGGDSYVDGQFGQAFNFNGSEYIQSNLDPMDFSKNFTVSAFYRASEVDSFYSTIWSVLGDAYPGLLLIHGGGGSYTLDNKLYFLSVFCGSQWFDTGYTFSDINWHNFVTERVDDSFYFYVDGVQLSNVADATGCTKPDPLFYIGVQMIANRYCDGSIDDVLVFDRALSASEIASLYNATVNQYNNNFTNLSNGNYAIQGFAVDSAGNVNNTAVVDVVLDTTIPLITIISPENTTYNTNQISINFTAEDNITLDRLWFNNGTDNVSYIEPITITALEGSNTITFYANDSAGNVNSTSVTFNVDSIAPLLSIASPTFGAYNNATVLVNISSDGNNVWYNIGGENITYTTPFYVTFSEGSNTLRTWANDSVGNTGSASVTFSVDSIAPVIAYINGTENVDETVKDSFNVNVSLNETNVANVTYLLYYSNGTLANSQVYLSNITSHSWNVANGSYKYDVTVRDVAGNAASTDNRTVKVVSSCLEQCVEGSNCTITSDCVLNNGLCGLDNVCTFNDLTIGAKVYTLYDLAGNGNDLTLNLTSTTPGSSITFGAGNSVIFSGKNGSDIGAGSVGGNAGIVNITVYDLFNTTGAFFVGTGGNSTSEGANGGNGGQMQLNYHGLIRQFDDCQYGGRDCGAEGNTQMLMGAATGGENYTLLSDANPVYNFFLDVPWPIMNKNTNCIINNNRGVSERDADANGDGVVNGIDLDQNTGLKSMYNKRVNDSGYDENYDIACRDKINVVAISRIGMEYQRGA